MDNRKVLGIAGSIVLFVGIFAPIVSLPIVGNQNYFQNGKGDGVLLLVLAGASLLVTLREEYRSLWLTGLTSFGVLAFTFWSFQSKMAEVRSQMSAELAGNPFRGLAEAAIGSVQLQWGWAVLVVGASLLIAGAAMKAENPAGPEVAS